MTKIHIYLKIPIKYCDINSEYFYFPMQLSYICIVYQNRNDMKVTAIIPDDIIHDVQEHTGGKNITDSLIKALNDWLYMKRIEKLNRELKNEPLQFKEGFSAEYIRKLNKRI